MELVKQWYGRRIGRWEHDLATRSTDRVVRPFDWGMEWSRNWPFAVPEGDPETRLREFNKIATERSSEFFAYEPPRDFVFEGDEVRFTSAVDTPYPENNLVRARYFPASLAGNAG